MVRCWIGRSKGKYPEVCGALLGVCREEEESCVGGNPQAFPGSGIEGSHGCRRCLCTCPALCGEKAVFHEDAVYVH